MLNPESSHLENRLNNSPIILLLSGKAGSGKDAAAALLVEEMQFERLAFATSLKKEVSESTGIPIHFFHDHGKKDDLLDLLDDVHKTPRTLLLDHAAKIRATDPDYYSRHVAAVIKEYTATASFRIVISDWRYRREYEFLTKELGATCTILRARITRKGVRMRTEQAECDLDNERVDFTIANDGCISDLRDTLHSIVRGL